MSGETISAHLHVEWWGSDTAAGCRLLVVVVAGAGHQICPAVASVVTDRRCKRNLQ